MSTLMTKYRAHRAHLRRTRAINRALAASPSPTVRDELLAIASRY